MQVIWIQKKQYKLINHYRMLKANILRKFQIQGVQNKNWSKLISDSMNKSLPHYKYFKINLRIKNLKEWTKLISRISLIKTLFIKIIAFNKTTVKIIKIHENDWINIIILIKGNLRLIIVIMRDQNLIILENMIAKWIKKRKSMIMEKKIKKNKIMFKIYNKIKIITKSIIILYPQSLIITNQMFRMIPKS